MIKIGRVGRIEAGGEKGKFVRIEELADSPPSYLILMAFDKEFSNGCGDYWIQHYGDLEDFFREDGWAVDWLDR